MKLFHRMFGPPQNPPLVIVHGLAGSSRDWITTAERLAPDYCVYAIDMRNHGESPYSETMNFDCMTEDLLEWLKQENLGRIHLLGHSVGGKGVMHFACKHPEWLQSLIVVEMAPKAYDPTRRTEFDAMIEIEQLHINDKEEARALLSERVQSTSMIDYLLESFIQDASGNYFWQMNLDVLPNRLKELRLNPIDVNMHFDGPTLFIRGGQSTFIQDSDLSIIAQHFPKATVEKIPDANHLPHHTTPEPFLTLVREFLAKH